MMCQWITYLRVNHPELFRNYLEDQEKARATGGFVGMLANDQRWSARVNGMLEVKRS